MRTVRLPETATVLRISTAVTGFVMLKEESWFISVTELIKFVTVIPVSWFVIETAVTGLATVKLPETATVLLMLRSVTGFVIEIELTGFKIVTDPEIAAVFEMLIEVTGFKTVKAEI